MRRAILAVVVLLPFLIAAGQTTSTGDVHCRVFTPSIGTVDECQLGGAVSRLQKNPVQPMTAFEPTMHAGPDGDLYYALTDDGGVTIGFGAGVAHSGDLGATWEDVTPTLGGEKLPPETYDPYVYVDPWTGRVFSFHMDPILTCSILSFSDDKGETWTTNPVGCGPTGVWDHQTLVAAPPTEGTALLGDYPNVLVQCVNAIYAAVCARSLDGGLTWTHGVPVEANTWLASGNGAQHGHLVSEADGTIYLPTSEGGKNPVVFISRDSGLTWERSQISDKDMPFQDPTIAVDDAGTIWAAFQDNAGVLWLSSSTDDGASWSEDVRITPEGVIGTKPAMVAGDAGHIAIAYPGTDDVASFGEIGGLSDLEQRAVVWGGFVTASTDADQPDASFTTVEVTGDDPLIRGGDGCISGDRCKFEVDFIEATVTPDGQVFASFSDGCIRSCVTNPTGNNDAGSVGAAVAVTLPLDEFDLCAGTCGRFVMPEGVAASHSTATAPLKSQTVSSSAGDPATTWFTPAQLGDYARRAATERARWAAGRP